MALAGTRLRLLFDRLGLPEALVAVLSPRSSRRREALGRSSLWRRAPGMSGITDGIVYCGLSAIGFAMVENVLYLGGHGYAAGADQYGPATGIQNVFLIFIVRILFTGFAHPLFTSMAGVGMGLAARAGDRRVKWLAPIAGLLLAMILHGLFNLLPTLSVATGETLIMLYGYLGFMVPFFFATVGFAIALRGWEGRLSERILPYYVRTGWLSPPEVAALSSLGRRHSARRWAKRVAGDAGLKAMRSFQFAATQLAILRDGMQRGLDRKPAEAQRTADEERRLLEAISGYRSVFTGRDPQMPPAFWDGSSYRIAFPDGVTRTVSAPEEPVCSPGPAGAPAGAGVGGCGVRHAWSLRRACRVTGRPPRAGYGTGGSASAYGDPPRAGSWCSRLRRVRRLLAPGRPRRRAGWGPATVPARLRPAPAYGQPRPVPLRSEPGYGPPRITGRVSALRPAAVAYGQQPAGVALRSATRPGVALRSKPGQEPPTVSSPARVALRSAPGYRPRIAGSRIRLPVHPPPTVSRRDRTRPHRQRPREPTVRPLARGHHAAPDPGPAPRHD